MLACEVGDTNLVGKLISKGADLYAYQDDGMNAFYYAIKYWKYDCAKMLLDKLDVEKCSQVEDGGLKLNLFQFVGKYCYDETLCQMVKSKNKGAWFSALGFWHWKGDRRCLARCKLNQKDDAKELLMSSPTVQMADDLYDRGLLTGYLDKIKGQRDELVQENPSFEDVFAFLERRELAEKGNADAQNELGMQYMRGRGVNKDGDKAFEWFKKATETDRKHIEAWTNLGECYEKGIGTEKNIVKAKECRQKAQDLIMD